MLGMPPRDYLPVFANLNPHSTYPSGPRPGPKLAPWCTGGLHACPGAENTRKDQRLEEKKMPMCKKNLCTCNEKTKNGQRNDKKKFLALRSLTRKIEENDRCSKWSNVFGANRRLANAKSSMLQENNPDAACMYVHTFDVHGRESTARHSTAQHGTAPHSRAGHGTVPYGGCTELCC